MKHLKTYENLTNYKSGDYVLLNMDEIYSNVNNDGDEEEIFYIESDEEPIAKIIKIIKNEIYPYLITFNDQETSVSEKEILRKLTPEELYDIEVSLNKNKFNI